MAWNKPNTENHPTPKPTKSPSLRRGFLAGLAVTVIAAGVLFLLTRDGDEITSRTVKKAPARIAEQKPAAATTNAVAAKAEVVEDPSKRIVEVLSCKTNAGVGQICRVFKTADGKLHKDYTPAYRPWYRHQTDQLLTMALSTRPGGYITPIPMRANDKSLDKAFLKSLKDPIVINDSDSPRLKERKQQVIEARARIKELMDQGMHFSEILADYVRLSNENTAIHSRMQAEYNRIHESGDAESERAYQIKIDAALSQMGIDPLDAPTTKAERQAAISERLRQRQLEKQQKPQQ